MSFSYFDPYGAQLDRQEFQIELRTAIFQGKLLERTCSFLEFPKVQTKKRMELVHEKMHTLRDEVLSVETTSVDSSIHVPEGTKISAPLWMTRALMNLCGDTILKPYMHNCSTEDFDDEQDRIPSESSSRTFARIIVPNVYSSTALHRLATPAFSTKHMMNEFAASNLNNNPDEYFYDLGMYVSLFHYSSEKGIAIANEIYTVYQNRFYYILRGACSGINMAEIRCIREQKIARGMIILQ